MTPTAGSQRTPPRQVGSAFLVSLLALIALTLLGLSVTAITQTEMLIGKCSVEAQDYGTAIAALDRAANLDPSLVGVNLYRGISLYHLDDYDAARSAFGNARTVGEDTALLDFYNGLLLFREDKLLNFNPQQCVDD